MCVRVYVCQCFHIVLRITSVARTKADASSIASMLCVPKSGHGDGRAEHLRVCMRHPTQTTLTVAACAVVTASSPPSPSAAQPCRWLLISPPCAPPIDASTCFQMESTGTKCRSTHATSLSLWHQILPTDMAAARLMGTMPGRATVLARGPEKPSNTRTPQQETPTLTRTWTCCAYGWLWVLVSKWRQYALVFAWCNAMSVCLQSATAQSMPGPHPNMMHAGVDTRAQTAQSTPTQPPP